MLDSQSKEESDLNSIMNYLDLLRAAGLIQM